MSKKTSGPFSSREIRTVRDGLGSRDYSPLEPHGSSEKKIHASNVAKVLELINDFATTTTNHSDLLNQATQAAMLVLASDPNTKLDGAGRLYYDDDASGSRLFSPTARDPYANDPSPVNAIVTRALRLNRHLHDAVAKRLTDVWTFYIGDPNSEEGRNREVTQTLLSHAAIYVEDGMETMMPPRVTRRQPDSAPEPSSISGRLVTVWKGLTMADHPHDGMRNSSFQSDRERLSPLNVPGIAPREDTDQSRELGNIQIGWHVDHGPAFDNGPTFDHDTLG